MQSLSAIIFSGLPGTGKTRLADAVAAEFGVPVFSVAWLLGALARFGALELPSRGDMAYELCSALLEHHLRLGQSAIVDGMVGSRVVRARWRQLAESHSAEFKVIECVCSDPTTHRQRVEARDDPIPGWPDPGWGHVAAMRPRYEPWDEERLVTDSVLPFAENLLAVRRFLGGCERGSPRG